MPTALRDRYEWDRVLSSIEMLRDNPDGFPSQLRITEEELASIETKIEAALERNPDTEDWRRIPVQLTQEERGIVNTRLLQMNMERASFRADHLEWMTIYAKNDDYAEEIDRVRYLLGGTHKFNGERLFFWAAPDALEW